MRSMKASADQLIDLSLLPPSRLAPPNGIFYCLRASLTPVRGREDLQRPSASNGVDKNNGLAIMLACSLRSITGKGKTNLNLN